MLKYKALVEFTYTVKGARFIASTDKNSSLTRHIAIRHFFCRELVRSGEVDFGHVPGTDNLADMATKPLEHVKQAEYATLILAKPS